MTKLRRFNIKQLLRLFCLTFTVLILLLSLRLLYLSVVDWNKVQQPNSKVWELSKRLTTQHLCLKNVLDLRNCNCIGVQNFALIKTDNKDLMSLKTSGCYLLHYKREHVVKCLDFLDREKVVDIKAPKMAQDRRWLHFAFMGDSRIRQQFINFLQLMPDYERSYKKQIYTAKFQEDQEITFHVLNLKLSFKWRPYFDVGAMDTIRYWTNSNETCPPQWVLMGMTAWDIMAEEYTDFQTYLKEASIIASEVNNLAEISKVIWLNQYPTVEFFGKIKEPNSRIYTEKIHRYNKLLRSILGSYKNIQIWDSSNPFAEEYVRSCILLNRRTLGAHKVPEQRNCTDFIHTGYAALEEATQILFNDLCNTYIQKIS